MDSRLDAEVISTLRLIGAAYEPDNDRELVGLSGAVPRIDPPDVEKIKPTQRPYRK